MRSKYNYAIIGAGDHATTNLYPCIWHLGIPVSRICTRTLTNAEKAAARFPRCTGTDSIETILEDTSIKGVFVCTPPKLHSELVGKLLASGKSVYVEKPLGYSEKELKNIFPPTFDSWLQMGMQRQFSPIGKTTKALLKNPINYHYKFTIGSYPEGDVWHELFIHQLDYCLFLFGPAKLEFCTKTPGSNGITYFINLDHQGVKGMIELSTNHSWNASTEELTINQADTIIQSNYPAFLQTSDKPVNLAGIPLEKIKNQSTRIKNYLLPGSPVPSIQNNSAYLFGFYPSIQSFFQAVEQEKKTQAEIHQLIRLYQLIDELIRH